MNEVTIVRHFNSMNMELATTWCKNDQEIRQAVIDVLECLEDGDSILFEVVSE